ncbi:MAG: protein kinase [Bacteroidota bacterium]|nr:protein kinase [Bacteroidota bacterium]
MIGQTISHYKILEKLGEGGMGVVYKAEDTKLKRTVALKFLTPELTHDLDAKKRFINEAQAASSLQHHNVCTIHDIDETDEGQIYICMDCYQGETLKKKIEHGSLKIDDAIGIALQVVQGLDKAHQNGIFHRDIKPANIFITNDGIVKILDFGLAKLVGRTMVTKTGSMMGTVAYMSPEQARGESVDHRTDIWSLGVILYEIIAGKLPFNSEYEQAIIYSILNEEPQPLKNLKTDIPDELIRIVVKSLQKDPEKRFLSTQEFLLDLNSLKKKRQVEVEKLQTEANKILPSIAVLPFVNMSADPENEYFSDGISEEIINALSKLSDLLVASRTSAFAFKGTKEDAREISRKLNVRHLLEGSVRKAGNRLRITAQLIRADDGFHIWSECYDREVADVFAIQDDIAQSIVNNLKVRLLEKEINKIKKRSTDNLDAYNAYLLGCYYLNKGTHNSLRMAITKFEEALSLSPDYAQACAQIANVYHVIAFADYCNPQDVYLKVTTFAKRAVELDPTSPEANAISATTKEYFEWDWDGVTLLQDRKLMLTLCFTNYTKKQRYSM